MKKYCVSAVLLVMLMSAQISEAYIGDYPPFGFKEPQRKPVNAQCLVDLDGGEYVSKDGKLKAVLKDGKDEFDFLLQGDGETLMTRTSLEETPVPCAVYRTDLNGDKNDDLIVLSNYRGCGLGAIVDHVDIFIKKKGHGYKLIAYDTFSAGIEDFLDINNDGKTEILTANFYEGEKHNYFVYRVYVIKGEDFVNVDKNVKGFPRFIWYTFKPNDKPAMSLGEKEKSEFIALVDRAMAADADNAAFYRAGMSERFILVLGVFENYEKASGFAKSAAKKTGMELKSENIPVTEKGYFPRRYSETYLSLEKAEAYDLQKGHIAVIAGIFDDCRAAEKALENIQKKYKDAYIKKTKLWMGCAH
jgi:signal peptidase I